MSEVPICQARANVMTYDDANRKWIASGLSPGLSKVQIYQHTVNHTFRVVGRKLQDHEVVINCAILKNLKYNQATPTFHQWRDSRHVYGLNFANKEDSESFANAMLTALDALNNQGRPMAPPAAPANPPPNHPPAGYQQQFTPQPPQQQQNGPQQQITEDNRSSRPDFQTHRRYPSGGAPAPYAAPQQPEPVSAPPQPPQPPAPPAAPPAPPAAPPAPPAPPAAPAAPPAPPAPGAPPAPPPPSVGGGAPPAPPPPPVGGNSPTEDGGGAPQGLAAALQAAKLKKLKKVEADGEVGSGGGAGSNTSNKPPIGGGPMDHMSELQKKIMLRATKTQEDTSTRNVSPSPTPPPQPTTSRPWEKPANGNKVTNGTGSPKLARSSPALHRRNPSLTGQEHIGGGTTEASAISNSELEALKQEILTEMRKEMNKMKQELLEAIRDSAR